MLAKTAYSESRATTAEDLLSEIAEVGTLMIRGAQAFKLLREAIGTLQQTAGVTVTFTPESEPRLRDYLVVGSLSAAEGAALGCVLGLLAGVLFDRPVDGLMLGLGAGAIAGAAHGIGRVNEGWRVTVRWDADNVPLALVSTSEW